MARLPFAIGVAGLLVASASAQSPQTTNNEIVWSSVAFVLYGDRTPLRGTTSPALTPLGAQQLHSQGAMFRTRYLESGDLTDGMNVMTTYNPINGLDLDAIDNSQLDLQSSTDQFSSASGLAFMQGFYPPKNISFAPGAGGLNAAVLANGTLIDFPLSGYQYPNLHVTSILDPESIWLEGNVECSEYQESLLEFRSDPTIQQVYSQTLPFYETMWTKFFSVNSAFPQSMANFWYAYDLWDYAQFQFHHSNASADLISATDLAVLRNFASTQQQDLNANLSASGLSPGDMIRAISGRTLASQVVTLFKSNMATTGVTNKLNLMFGSFEPFLAFFTLAGLITGPSAAVFEPLPDPGAAMIWELFSIGGNASVYPSASNLWVRFLYRNGTNSGAPFIEYSLFGNGNSQSYMRFDDFVSSMASIGVGSVSNWCTVCQGVSVFCPAAQQGSSGSGQSGSGSGGSGGLNPVVAGVIGAIVAIVVGAFALLAMVFWRRKDGKRNSTLRGFKGAEKMASDTDVTYAKSGTRQERIGSWELRGGGDDGPTAVTAAAASPAAADVEEGDTSGAAPTKVTSHFGLERIDDDAMSDVGHKPVEPRESI